MASCVDDGVVVVMLGPCVVVEVVIVALLAGAGCMVFGLLHVVVFVLWLT